MEPLGCAHSVAHSDIYGRVAYILHVDVTYVHILHHSAVHGLEGESPTVCKRTVFYLDTSETTVTLCPQLNTSCRSVTVGSLLYCGKQCAVKERADVIAAHMAVLYEHVFRRLWPAESIRAFKHYGIVIQRVDFAIPYHYTFTTVYVKAVTVSVSRYILYQQVVNSCEQHGEVSALQETDATHSHPAAVAHCQRLVRLPFHLRMACRTSRQHAGAIYQSLSLNGNVVQVLAPYQGVVPMAVPKVLVLRVVMLRLVISVRLCYGCRFDYSPSLQSQRNV